MEQSKQIITYFLMRIESIRIDTIQFVWWIVNNKMNVRIWKKGIIKKKKIQKRKTKNKLESYNTKKRKRNKMPKYKKIRNKENERIAKQTRIN